MRVVLGDCTFEANGSDQAAVSLDYDKWEKAVRKRARRQITDQIAALESQLRMQRQMLREFYKAETK